MLNQIIKDCHPYNAQLVAVSKTKPNSAIREVYDLGQRHFGENRVQELSEKYESLPKDIHWHLIGSLQTNKVKYIAPFVHLIHSVDRISLLKEINKQGKKINRKIPILLQFKIASEASKNGADLEELKLMAQGIQTGNYPYVELKGMMGMATFTDDENVIRKEFKKLKIQYDILRKEHSDMNTLSMGMSGDYKMALEEGSTMVRVGSLIFGHR